MFNVMSPPQITELFTQGNKHSYKLRQSIIFLQPFGNYVHCGTKTISYLRPKIWGMIPDTYKNKDVSI